MTTPSEDIAAAAGLPALRLAQQETAGGASAEAKRVAQDVSTTQSTEIREMKQLLAQV
jgi:uncharacterized protein (DUF305 family)